MRDWYIVREEQGYSLEKEDHPHSVRVTLSSEEARILTQFHHTPGSQRFLERVYTENGGGVE